MRKYQNKPKNWQDFEILCYHLWKKEFKCRMISLHGRQGQPQFGVDIYGELSNNDYFGIQCKGKDDYNNSKLTTQEINSEIEKARKFNPQLKLFIIATTSSRDAKLQEYIREKDKESQVSYGFHVDVKFWEDIEDLLDFHKDVSDWYNNNVSSKEETYIKKIIDIKQGKTLVEKLTHTLPSNNKELSHIFYNPWLKFKYNKVIIRSIYDETYPSFCKKTESWRIDCLFDVSSDGLMINTGYALNHKVCFDKNKNWWLVENQPQDFFLDKKVVFVHQVCTLPFENIVGIEENGDDFYCNPIIRVRPTENDKLYSKVEYIYLSETKHTRGRFIPEHKAEFL